MTGRGLAVAAMLAALLALSACHTTRLGQEIGFPAPAQRGL